MNENGHIYAPVSVEDVKTVLNERSNDVAALCMSDKINPYSLIRPMPVLESWVGVKDMKLQRVGDIPPSNQNYAWERKQWGYQVPYVRNPQIIEEIADIAWYRPNVGIADKKNLDHFDGYLHDAIPSLIWNIGEVQEGDEIRLLLAFGVQQTDIVSASGKGNNGGVVSVFEVFGDAPFYYGVKIQYGSNYTFAYGGPVNPGENTSGVINTGIIARSSTRYRFTPFICNRDATTITPDLQVYSLKFAPDYEPVKEIYVPETTVGVQIWVAEQQGSTITKFRIVVFNNFNYAWETSNLTLKIVTYYPFNVGGGVSPDGTTMGGNTSTSYRQLNETLKVGANETRSFEWETRVVKDLAATRCIINASGTLRSAYGRAQQYETNVIILE